MHSASNASKIDDEQPRSWKLSGGGGGGNFCPRARAQTVARGIDRMATRAGSNALSLAGNTNSPMMTAGHMCRRKVALTMAQHTRGVHSFTLTFLTKFILMQTKLCWISEDYTRTDELFKCLDVADRYTCIQAL